ncbi:MAG TPA: hypothetical protein PK954_19610, partial [Anaerolineales bacterium]|nr:hypothetical protein [Anaerolineales bacterium]
MRGLFAFLQTGKCLAACDRPLLYLVLSKTCTFISQASVAAHVAGAQDKETAAMARPVTLFTGQWADLPFEVLCAKAKSFGYDGLEIACWGDHFEVDKALSDDAYIRSRHDILAKHGLKSWAISNHLVGQAVCDNIDGRHKSIVPARIWGDGKEDGVRRRAQQEIMDTAP